MHTKLQKSGEMAVRTCSQRVIAESKAQSSAAFVVGAEKSDAKFVDIV